MARLGRAERQLVRQYHARIRAERDAIVAANLASPKPEIVRYAGFRATPDSLQGLTHTRGFTLGQRRLAWQKPGSF